MQNSNKRKNSSKVDKKAKIQCSIANFFGQIKKEEKSDDMLIDSKEEESTKPDFFTSCMYSDEFDLLLETVLKEESFLFNEQEIQKFKLFRSIKGFDK